MEARRARGDLDSAAVHKQDSFMRERVVPELVKVYGGERKGCRI